MLQRLFPKTASNDYRGARTPLVAFCVIATVTLGRSLIHFLKDDSGVNSIATLITFPGTPDPNPVIYMFSSLWGTQQLITVAVYAVVLLRYRNLIPLMYALLILEVVLRMTVGTIHPLGDEYFARTPPGKIGSLPLLLVSSAMLFWSLRAPREQPAPIAE